MKILHTADWHLGQVFYQYDRSYEHGLFLDWLLKTLKAEDIDVLLVSGDVFDVSNPSALSIRLFYTFLNKASQLFPHLQIIVTAGNHDSGTRLEAPRPLLESSKIHIIGVIPRTPEGEINYEELIIPLTNKNGDTQIWCMAVPFLRIGDYPSLPGAVNTYSEGVCAFYNQLYQLTLQKKLPGQVVIAMGHLHALNITLYDKDSHDREIMGGVECIPLAAFHNDISYVALGHIHRAQKVANKHHVRYCGSPLPLSFSEINYSHQVLVANYDDPANPVTTSLEVPVSIALMKIPNKPKSLPLVLEELLQLGDGSGKNPDLAPYLEVHVHLEGPEPSLRYQIENALRGKYVRLTRILASYERKDKEANVSSLHHLENSLSPQSILKKVYERKFNNDLPDDLLQLFNEVNNQVSQKEI